MKQHLKDFALSLAFMATLTLIYLTLHKKWNKIWITKSKNRMIFKIKIVSIAH